MAPSVLRVTLAPPPTPREGERAPLSAAQAGRGHDWLPSRGRCLHLGPRDPARSHRSGRSASPTSATDEKRGRGVLTDVHLAAPGPGAAPAPRAHAGLLLRLPTRLRSPCLHCTAFLPSPGLLRTPGSSCAACPPSRSEAGFHWPQGRHASAAPFPESDQASQATTWQWILLSFQLVTAFLVRGQYVPVSCHTALSAFIYVGLGHRLALANGMLAHVTEPPLSRSSKNHHVALLLCYCFLP